MKKLTLKQVLRKYKKDMKNGLYVLLESNVTGSKQKVLSVVGLTKYGREKKKYILLHQYENGFCGQVYPEPKFKVINTGQLYEITAVFKDRFFERVKARMENGVNEQTSNKNER